MGPKQMARLMCQSRIQGIHRRRNVSTTKRNPERVAAPDLVRRQFTATGPDQIWGLGYHLRSHHRRVPVSGGRDRCLIPAGSGMVHARRHGNTVGHRHPEHKWRPFLWCTGGEGPYSTGLDSQPHRGIRKTVRRDAVVNTRMDELVWSRNQLEAETRACSL